MSIRIFPTAASMQDTVDALRDKEIAALLRAKRAKAELELSMLMQTASSIVDISSKANDVAMLNAFHVDVKK